ncbi:MAG: 4-hydroxy-3-methylbut-2-enyl diphosphate reductase [Oscillospiraceae bacterium]|nr:4-hydroxy-3-methylbut-2-enyl diphosphate reductase [Oscillospiraceae bacterium]
MQNEIIINIIIALAAPFVVWGIKLLYDMMFTYRSKLSGRWRTFIFDENGKIVKRDILKIRVHSRTKEFTGKIKRVYPMNLAHRRYICKGVFYDATMLVVFWPKSDDEASYGVEYLTKRSDGEYRGVYLKQHGLNDFETVHLAQIKINKKIKWRKSMDITISKYAGFCFGVALAVSEAYECKAQNLYLLGDVVHNPVVIGDLKNRGRKIVESFDEIQNKADSTVLIRAHGVGKNVIDDIRSSGASVIDKTCPKVKKVHKIVEEASKNGNKIIIIGKIDHPEVLGIKGWGESEPIIIDEIEQAEGFFPSAEWESAGVCVVVQTTYNKVKYQEIVNVLLQKISNIKFNDTICEDTGSRQKEIAHFASISDAVVVVGGKNSSNSVKLFEISKGIRNNTCHIEKADELDMSTLRKCRNVFVTSGASTPQNSIDEVLDKIKHFLEDNNIVYNADIAAEDIDI